MPTKERKVVLMDDYHKKLPKGSEPTFDPTALANSIGETNPEARHEWVWLRAIRQAADTLKEARAAAGISQLELAKRTGLQQSAISRLENTPLAANATSDGPGVAHLARILDECGCELVITFKMKK